MAPPDRRPEVGPKKPRPVPRRDRDFDAADAREKAKAVPGKAAREKFNEAIDVLVRQRTELADIRGRLRKRIERAEELEAKLAQRELRRVQLGGGGEAILLPLSARAGDMYFHPDGRVWKLGDDESTMVLVGDRG